jgi:hypothetical protein
LCGAIAKKRAFMSPNGEHELSITDLHIVKSPPKVELLFKTTRVMLPF